MLKLYVSKDGKKFEELSAMAVGNGIEPLRRISINHAIKKYLKSCTSQKCKKNQKVELVFFDKFEKFFDEKSIVNLDQIKLDHLEDLHIHFLTWMKPISAKRRFSVYRNFFEKCIDWEYLITNPMKKLKYRKIEKNHFKFWSDSEFNLFLNDCSGPQRDMLKFLWLTGARPAEAKNLKWCDIDYDNRILYLKCDKNNSIKREFPLDKDLDKFLHGLKLTGSYVFNIDGKQMNGDNLYQYAKHRLIRLGLANLTIYGLRHSFANRLSVEGVNAFHIQKMMGHSDIKTTMNYQNPDSEQIMKSLLKIRK